VRSRSEEQELATHDRFQYIANGLKPTRTASDNGPCRSGNNTQGWNRGMCFDDEDLLDVVLPIQVSEEDKASRRSSSAPLQGKKDAEENDNICNEDEKGKENEDFFVRQRALPKRPQTLYKEDGAAVLQQDGRENVEDCEQDDEIVISQRILCQSSPLSPSYQIEEKGAAAEKEKEEEKSTGDEQDEHDDEDEEEEELKGRFAGKVSPVLLIGDISADLDVHTELLKMEQDRREQKTYYWEHDESSDEEDEKVEEIEKIDMSALSNIEILRMHGLEVCILSARVPRYEWHQP
jgi:hypothetical protein